MNKEWKDKIQLTNLPQHIAVIMDGNGRWARRKGALRIFGHQNAIEAVRQITEGSAELGINYLTLYAFSTENWGRPQEEIDGLMKLLISAIRSELPTLIKNNIRLLIIGAVEELPIADQEELKIAIEKTKPNTHMTLIIALNYSGRWDMVQATKKIALKVKQGEITIDEINEEIFSSSLSTHSIPDPELFIRTSGEMRVSNFLLWQIAYTELFITDILWPDFRKENLYEAIYAYQKRERRFGKTSEQLKK